MYWPTSFCERENSSKRWRISEERVSAEVPDRVTRKGFARSAGVPSAEVRVRRHAAVHEQGGTRHVVGLRAREPGDGGRDLLRLPDPPQGDLRRDRLARGGIVDQRLVDRREDRP